MHVYTYINPIYFLLTLSLSLLLHLFSLFWYNHSDQFPKFETKAGAQQPQQLTSEFSMVFSCFWWKYSEAMWDWAPSLLQAILWKPLKFLLPSSQHPPSSVSVVSVVSLDCICLLLRDWTVRCPTVWFYMFYALEPSAPLEALSLGPNSQIASCPLLFDFCCETWLSMSGWFRVMCDRSLANWSRSVFSHTEQLFFS